MCFRCAFPRNAAKRSSPHYLLYRAALLTGMRQGELLGLPWKDLDFASEIISVQQSLCRVAPVIMFKEPKTQKGRRTVALPPCWSKNSGRHEAMHRTVG